MSWTFVNDSLCTTLCLQWEPEIIAIAVMYLAVKLSKFEVKDWANRQPHQQHWWDQYVEGLDSTDLEEICHQVLDIYTQHVADAKDAVVTPPPGSSPKVAPKQPKVKSSKPPSSTPVSVTTAPSRPKSRPQTPPPPPSLPQPPPPIPPQPPIPTGPVVMGYQRPPLPPPPSVYQGPPSMTQSQGYPVPGYQQPYPLPAGHSPGMMVQVPPYRFPNAPGYQQPPPGNYHHRGGHSRF